MYQNFNDIEACLSAESLKEFWDFVQERQRIYLKRKEGKPAPWTKDPILQRVFFTNVYRENDTGTKFLIENVLGQGTPQDEFFEIVVYRYFNNIRTYEAMRDEYKRPYGSWENWEEIAKYLHGLASRVGVIFTRAHMTASNRFGGFPKKADNTSWVLDQHWQKKELNYNCYMATPSLKDAWTFFDSLIAIGEFLAYEIVTDLNLSPRLRKFTDNDWANPGPGCRKGLCAIFPGIKELPGLNMDSFLKAIHWLRNNQPEEFLRENPPLTLRNVEHSLCEFYKYHAAKYEGYVRRGYKKGGYRLV